MYLALEFHNKKIDFVVQEKCSMTQNKLQQKQFNLEVLKHGISDDISKM